MKKALSSILASVVAAVLAVTSMSVSMPINAHAEDGTPSVTAFATADDLRNANNFTLHTDNGFGVARKVYFGMNSERDTVKTWYIAGADSDGSLILMCDPANPLVKRVFHTSAYGIQYASSDIREYLIGEGISNHFTTQERGLMKNPTLSTYDSADTADELYLASGGQFDNFITVGMNGTKIGLNNNGPSGGSPYIDREKPDFWLRDKYMDWAFAACADPGVNVTNYGVTGSFNVVPVFNLDMTNVLFASTAKPATSGSDMGDAMTFRMKNNGQFASTVKKNEQTISVMYGSGDSDVYLYVQGRNSEGDWVKAVAISEDEEYTLEDIGVPSGADLSKCEVWLEKTIERVTYAEWIPIPKADAPKGETYSAPGHVHKYEWQIITEPTKDTDGLEGEMCSCGATRNTQKLSAYAYALYQYAMPMINNAKPGQTITFEFGEWNSFPKSFMEKIAAKSMEGVTFVFHYKWNHEKQEITIPFGTAVDTQFDWYGPAKLAELYGMN